MTIVKLTKLEEFWLSKGYVSVRMAVDKTDRSPHTIYRAIESAELEVKTDGKQRFVSIKSLIAWIGPEAAKARGLAAPAGIK